MFADCRTRVEMPFEDDDDIPGAGLKRGGGGGIILESLDTCNVCWGPCGIGS